MQKKKELEETEGYKVIQSWLNRQGRQPFVFQKATWKKIRDGESGLVNAPTGYGKRFSVTGRSIHKS